MMYVKKIVLLKVLCVLNIFLISEIVMKVGLLQALRLLNTFLIPEIVMKVRLEASEKLPQG